MIKINDMIKATSNMIYNAVKETNYNYKITDDENQRQLFLNKNKGLFFISAQTVSSRSVNLHFDVKSIEININCFQSSDGKKRDLYEIKNLLDTVFVRSIKVGKRYIHIKNVDGVILKDDIGFWLNYSVLVSYHEQVVFDVDDTEVMREILLTNSDVLKVESEG